MQRLITLNLYFVHLLYSVVEHEIWIYIRKGLNTLFLNTFFLQPENVKSFISGIINIPLENIQDRLSDFSWHYEKVLPDQYICICCCYEESKIFVANYELLAFREISIIGKIFFVILTSSLRSMSSQGKICGWRKAF